MRHYGVDPLGLIQWTATGSVLGIVLAIMFAAITYFPLAGLVILVLCIISISLFREQMREEREERFRQRRKRMQGRVRGLRSA